MFPAPWFAPRYFPARYWPKNGSLAVEGAPSTSFEIRTRGDVYVCERRGAVYERVAESAVFAAQARGDVFETAPRGAVFFVEEL